MVTCTVGDLVKVPSLGRLRELSGKGRYESSICDTIKRMVASGELPRAAPACFREADRRRDRSRDPRAAVFRSQRRSPRNRCGCSGSGPYLYIALFHRSQIEEEGATTVYAPRCTTIPSQSSADEPGETYSPAPNGTGICAVARREPALTHQRRAADSST